MDRLNLYVVDFHGRHWDDISAIMSPAVLSKVHGGDKDGTQSESLCSVKAHGVACVTSKQSLAHVEGALIGAPQIARMVPKPTVSAAGSVEYDKDSRESRTSAYLVMGRAIEAASEI